MKRKEEWRLEMERTELQVLCMFGGILGVVFILASLEILYLVGFFG